MKLKDNSTQEIDTALYQLEQKLKSNIRLTDVENSNASSAKINAVDKKLTEEIKDRQSADEKLQDNINKEIADRKDADAAIENAKQDKLIAGNNIQIDGNVISAISKEYTAEAPVKVTDGKISLDTVPVAKGGTGATTAKEAEYNIVVPTQNATIDAEAITDESRWTGTYVSPSKTTGRLYTKKFNVVWNYIKDKISSILGLTKDNYGGKASTAGTADKVANALTVNGKTYDGSSAVNAGVQTVANGGTGVTTQADINKAFIGNLEVGNSDVTDGTEFVSSNASDNGFAETGALNKPYKRQFIKVWNYIKDKISSVLGLTSTNYGGKASTAGTADKATNDGNGNNIVNTYALKSNLQYTKSINIAKVNGSSNTLYYLIAKTPGSDAAGNIESLFVNGSDYMNRMFEGSIRTRDGNFVYNYGKNNLPIELYEQTDGAIYVYWLVSDAYNRVALNITATTSITIYGGNLSPVTPTGSKMTLTEYDYKSYGTLPVARGGTGQTTAKAAANSFINSLELGTSAPVDADYFISQSAGGGTTNTAYYRRPISKLWEYIKSKISSVLGLTKDNYGGKASTATTADKTINDITIEIPYVQESGQYVIPFGNIPEPTSTEVNSPYNWDITGFFSIIRPTGHNGSHLWFEAGHGYSHDWKTYAYLDKVSFRGVETAIEAFQYEGKWWLGLNITTPNQGYLSKMTITFSRGLPAMPTCILYNSKSGGIANEEIYNSLQDIPSSWWIPRTIYNPITFTQKITAPVIKATTNFIGNLTGNVTGNVSGSSGSAGKLTTARTAYVDLGTASTTRAIDWSGDTTIPVDGVLQVEHGGTGAKTAQGAADLLIASLPASDRVPVDSDYFISQVVNGGPFIPGYERRPISKLWEYIKGKILQEGEDFGYDHVVYDGDSLLEWANCTDGSMKKVLIKSGTYNMTKGVDFSKAGTGYVFAEQGAVINSKVPIAFSAPSGKTTIHNLHVVCGPSSDNSCAFSASNVLNLILYDCEASYSNGTVTVNRNLFSKCTCYNCHYNFTYSSSNSSMSIKVFYQCYCYNCICKQTIAANSSSAVSFNNTSYFYMECVCISCDAELTILRNIKAANPTFSCYYNCWDRCIGCLSKIDVNSKALTVYSTLYGFLRCQHMSSCKETHTEGYTNIKGIVQCIYISSTNAVSGESNTNVGNSCSIA